MGTDVARQVSFAPEDRSSHPTTLLTIPHVTETKAKQLQTLARDSIGSFRGEVAEQLVGEQVRQLRHAQASEKRLLAMLETAYRALPQPNHLDSIKGLGIATAALALFRLLYFQAFGRHIVMSGDAMSFVSLGQQIDAGDVFLKFSSLYYYFLAVVYFIFGDNCQVVLFFQFGLGILTAYLLYVLARDLFGSLAGLFSLGLYACYGLILLYEGQLLDGSFSVLLPTGGLLFLRRATISGRLGNGSRPESFSAGLPCFVPMSCSFSLSPPSGHYLPQGGGPAKIVWPPCWD